MVVYPGVYTGLCTPCGIPCHTTRVVYTFLPPYPGWYILLPPYPGGYYASMLPGWVLCPPCYPGGIDRYRHPGGIDRYRHPGGILSTVPGWYPLYGTRVVSSLRYPGGMPATVPGGRPATVPGRVGRVHIPGCGTSHIHQGGIYTGYSSFMLVLSLF